MREDHEFYLIYTAIYNKMITVSEKWVKNNKIVRV